MKPVTLILLLSAAVLAAAPASRAYGQDTAGVSNVRNVRFTSERGEVRIVYDLAAKPGTSYHVSVALKRGGDPFFEYIPSGVTGDVGDDIQIGNGRVILWRINDEFPTGLPGEDYFFVVRAEPQGGGIPVIAIAGVGLAAAGGVAVYFLLMNGDQPLSSPGAYPGPPSRP